MAHHVLGVEERERDARHRAQHLDHVREARLPAGGQIGLGDVAGHDRLGAEADARQEHLHLLDGGVLGLVEDDEGIIERAAAHEGERRHLDDVALHEARHAIEAHHFVQRVVHRAQVRIDLLRHIPGEKPEALAGLHRRPHQDQPAHPVRLQRLHRAGDREIGLAGAGGAYAEGQIARADVVEVIALVGAARAYAAARHAHAVLARLRIRRRQAGLALAQGEMHALGGDLITLGEGEQLAQQSFRALGLGAAHAEGPAAATNVHVKTRLQQTQILIQRPAQIREPRIIRWTEGELPLRFGR